MDRYFGEKHRVFGRYTFFRDDDTPVTPLPDGSGSLTSGVIGHAITRGDALVGDYNWMISPSALNQFRVGYSRRDLNQTSLQNGGITVPGLPANSFASVLPIFTVTGLQQIGPTTAANSNFTTSITEFLDTFTLVRRPPHDQVRSRSPARGSGCSESAQSHRIVRLHDHGHEQLDGYRKRKRVGLAAAWDR